MFQWYFWRIFRISSIVHKVHFVFAIITEMYKMYWKFEFWSNIVTFSGNRKNSSSIWSMTHFFLTTLYSVFHHFSTKLLKIRNVIWSESEWWWLIWYCVNKCWWIWWCLDKCTISYGQKSRLAFRYIAVSLFLSLCFFLSLSLSLHSKWLAISHNS